MEIIKPRNDNTKNKGLHINTMNVLENIDEDEIEEIMGKEEKNIEKIRKEFENVTTINTYEKEKLQINMEEASASNDILSQELINDERRKNREEEEENRKLHHKEPINQKSFEFTFETPNKSKFTPTPLEQYETRNI